jgi:hypothetical protein
MIEKVVTMPEALQLADKTHKPVSPDAIRLANEAVRAFPGCFWFWRDDVAIETAADVAEVKRNLRLNGGRDAWEMAARIARCR